MTSESIGKTTSTYRYRKSTQNVDLIWTKKGKGEIKGMIFLLLWRISENGYKYQARRSVISIMPKQQKKSAKVSIFPLMKLWKHRAF